MHDMRQMLAYPFMVNALRAGTIVAVVAGAVGWVMVLRRESFAGHTLAVVGFPGAAAATWLGFAAGYGYFAACIVAAVVIAPLPARRAAGCAARVSSPPVIGTVQAFALAAGMLFVSLYKGFLSGLTNLLFGTIAGVTGQQVSCCSSPRCRACRAAADRQAAAVGLDGSRSRCAHGVPVRLVGGAVPGAAGCRRGGHQPGHRQPAGVRAAGGPGRGRASSSPAVPALGIAMSVVIALAVTWLGMGFAYFSPYPIGFWVSSFAFAVYLLAAGYRASVERIGGSSDGTGRRAPRAA